MIKFKIQKEKKINFGGRSNKVAQYMTDKLWWNPEESNETFYRVI